MKIRVRADRRGVALLVVMVAIFVLSVLVGAFAFSMKVETQLAMNASHDMEMVWLGRTGVERARYALAQQLMIGAEPFDSLMQKWAGGPGGLSVSNSPLANFVLKDFQIGNARIDVTIRDMERKFNINLADERILEQVLTTMQVDAGEIPAIIGATLDWIDPDDNTHVNGAESEHYEGLPRPYFAKNGPIDDLSELMLIRGITHEMFWGPKSTNNSAAAFQQADRRGRPVTEPTYEIGLEQVFTCLSSGRININTAPASTLQMIPFIDNAIATQLVGQRSGPDGVDGTDDDTPFRNVGEAAMAVNPQLVQQLQRYCDVRSRAFEVDVVVSVSGSPPRTFHAVLGRNSPRDVQILEFYWK